MRTRTKLCLIVLLGFSLTAARADDEHVYFGSLHGHSRDSDGTGTPTEAFQRARDIGHCDFFALTEHNHAVGIKPKHDPGEPAPDPKEIIALKPENYNGGPHSLTKAAQEATVPGVFVAIVGLECFKTKPGNHVNVFDVPNVFTIADSDFKALVGWLNRAENYDSTGQAAVLQLNHPNSTLQKQGTEYGWNQLGSQEAWGEAMRPLACMVEVISGPALSKTDEQPIPRSHESAYLHYLAEGLRLAPSVGQDNHYRTWGNLTTARTGIIADELTKPKLLAAMRARHVYATTDNDLRIIAHVNGGLAGEIRPLPPVGSELTIALNIADDDEPSAQYSIEVFSGVAGSHENAKCIDTILADAGDGSYSIEDVRFEQPGQYVFFKITQSNEDGDDDVAWTAPTWFGPPTCGTAVADTPSADSKLVASQKSAVYHTNPDCPSAKAIKAENRIVGAKAKEDNRTPHACPPVNP